MFGESSVSSDSSVAFGLRLAAARRAAGLTQEELGAALGNGGRDLGRGAVSSWEVGRTQPTAIQLAMLSERLKVSADYLLGLSRPAVVGFADLPPAVRDGVGVR